MSKVRMLNELSKDELLSLIYNNLEGCRVNHTCLCASCGEEEVKGDLIGFVCDECEKGMYDWPSTETNYFGE
jgi:hypothetical protein